LFVFKALEKHPTIHNPTPMKKFFLLQLMLVSFVSFSQNKIYYVSTSGNDSNTGLSKSSAWQNLSKINAFEFQPGDQVLFEGGKTFLGTLSFQSNDKGSRTNPIIVSSYGSGKATIDASGGKGIFVHNTGGIEVKNLIVKSNGVDNNSENGVEFLIDQTTSNIDYVRVENLDISGFGGRGILVWTGETDKGYNDFRIVYCNVYGNGMGGIETLGHWVESNGVWGSLFNHRNIYVGYSKAYFNYGVPTYTANHSGSGILVSGVDSALIEYCEAYENGSRNGNPYAGPVGIWLAEAKNSIIQYSESHHNKSGVGPDGGGFDIDGGAQNCIIQYSYSHNNAGAGYALFEWGSLNPFFNNVIRYNISQNDGRNRGYSGLMFWGPIENCEVYNNTIYTNNTGANATPSAVKFLDNHLKGVNVSNNIFYTTSGVNMISADASLTTANVRFQSNNYYSNATIKFNWGGKSFSSFEEWRSNAEGQERAGNQLLGRSVDPLFVNAGGGINIKPADGGDLTDIKDYKLQATSPVINEGLDLRISSGIDIGEFDFYKNSLIDALSINMGADASTQVTKFFPVKILNLIATIRNGSSSIDWSTADGINVDYYIVERSHDGVNYQAIGEVKAEGNNSDYKFTDNAPVEGTNYYRLKIIYNNASSENSKMVFVNHKKEILFTLAPNPARNAVTIKSNKQEGQKVIVQMIDLSGNIVYNQQHISGSLITIDLTRFSSGVYIIRLNEEISRLVVSK
jgi:hypothetical protein